MTQPFSGAASGASVTHEVVARVVVRADPPVPLPAELRYRGADPYAVCVSVGGPSGDPVDWVFARDLLAEGMCRPAGAGDVLVIPRHSCHRNAVRIVVRSRRGTAQLDIAAAAVVAFLAETETLVPSGTESRHLDLDRVVAELMAGSE
ncbi:SsgA family sporulation/cell division regulator [Streptomyces sp. NPDC093252]|uniref:SsgA family sporulation/cell division regulator n=1 Tax=Streptomyces sp. NPDC093252 TaxID=3154980 RepID=UPI00342F807F